MEVELTDVGKRWLQDHYPQGIVWEYDVDKPFSVHNWTAEFIELTHLGIPYRIPPGVDGQSTIKKVIGSFYTPSFAANRDGVSALAEISAFLAGIFFTGLLLFLQQKEQYNYVINLGSFGINSFGINMIQLISIPLSLTTIIFTFSSISFGLACFQSDDYLFQLIIDETGILFFTGLILFLISMSIVCFLIDISTGIFVFFTFLIMIAWLKR